MTARIEPKTLFGEKYVALQIPEQPATDHIQAGDTIKRSVVATEVEETLNDLYPLLRTVQPAELNKTLTALATALEGRGDRLGENLVTLDSYLKRINPQIPALVEDLRLLSERLRPLRRRVPRHRHHAAQLGDDRQHPQGPRGRS